MSNDVEKLNKQEHESKTILLKAQIKFSPRPVVRIRV